MLILVKNEEGCFGSFWEHLEFSHGILIHFPSKRYCGTVEENEERLLSILL